MIGARADSVHIDSRRQSASIHPQLLPRRTPRVTIWYVCIPQAKKAYVGVRAGGRGFVVCAAAPRASPKRLQRLEDALKERPDVRNGVSSAHEFVRWRLIPGFLDKLFWESEFGTAYEAEAAKQKLEESPPRDTLEERITELIYYFERKPRCAIGGGVFAAVLQTACSSSSTFFDDTTTKLIRMCLLSCKTHAEKSVGTLLQSAHEFADAVVPLLSLLGSPSVVSRDGSRCCPPSALTAGGLLTPTAAATPPAALSPRAGRQLARYGPAINLPPSPARRPGQAGRCAPRIGPA